MLLRPLALGVLLLLTAPVLAQEAEMDTVVVAEDPPTTHDIRVLHAIYNVEHPAFAATMHAANWTSLRMFYGAVPALWAGIYLLDDERDFKPAYLMTLTEVGTVGVVFALKNVIRRPRPYASLSTIAPRSVRHDDTFDPFSFPSGHAAVSFALATSASLSYPHWYVIAPAALWATSVSLSRPWLGAHYPTDIAVGAALGVGVAFGVHALGELLTPGFLRGDAFDDDDLGRRPPPTVHLVIPL